MTEQPPFDPNAAGQQAQQQAQQQPQQPQGQPVPPQGWTPPPGYGYPAPTAPTPGSATSALILGILSLIMCGLFTGIPAIFVGRNAIREIDASNGQLGGRSTANAGYILGIVGTAISAIGIVLFGVLLVFGLIFASNIDNCTFTDNGDNSSSLHCD
ncbi:DUF4190 domain-containing protein [Marmoricola sp. RAF53]|uniref:DUF4190 domain-containing protein n=1 Tax=Marmoricola sp. RAF53 TaxID=3233059 RepID=UPI003F952267